MQRRIERIGDTREQVNDIFTRAAAHKPTRENLNLNRANAEGELRIWRLLASCPPIKTIIRAFIAEGQSLPDLFAHDRDDPVLEIAEKRDLAARILKAERDLFYTKEKRCPHGA